MSDYNMYLKTEYLNDLKYCKKFIFSFGSNYSLGTRLFSKRVREDTIFFYAFLRYADELVDNPDSKMEGQIHSTLDEYIHEWNTVVNDGPSENTFSVIRSNYWLFKKNNIPFDYIDDFFYAMKQDITKSRYATYPELVEYMWGSASIVGHVMTFIAGYRDVLAFEHAQSLGEAMQLANFIRDIDEDYQERNRIYIPQQHLATFGVTESMIADKVMTPQLLNLLKYYVSFTEKLFKKGIFGISYLSSGKFSIFLASRMYRENIRILKKRNYDIFSQKIKLSSFRKFSIFISTIVLYPFWIIRN